MAFAEISPTIRGDPEDEQRGERETESGDGLLAGERGNGLHQQNGQGREVLLTSKAVRHTPV